MSCNIKFNKDKSINSVLDSNGNESTLFNDIANLPFVKTKENALELYKQVYESVPSDSKLVFISDEVIHNTYENALKTGENIEISVSTELGFTLLTSVPNNQDPSTVEGFVNKYIVEDIIEGQKVEYNGKNYFVAKGENYIEQKVNEDIFKRDLKQAFRNESLGYNEGLIEILSPAQYSYDSNQKKILEDLSKEALKTINDSSNTSQRPIKIDKADVKLKLLNILNKLGVDTLSISNYVEKYNNKNGIDPSVNALADIANRVVAFKDGLVSLEDLTEETMHFIVEALPSETVDELLTDINKSDEYGQHAAAYREIYRKSNKSATEQEIENLVRKEILGKVMKNAVLGRAQTESQGNLFQRVLNAIRNFFETISGNNTYRTQLKQINDIIDEIFIRDNLEPFVDPSNIEGNNFVLYSIDNRQSPDQGLNFLRGINKSLLNNLKQSYAAIKKKGTSLFADKLKLGQYEGRIDEVSQAAAAADFLALIQRQISHIENSLNASEREGKILSIDDKNVLTNLNSGVRALLEQQRKATEARTPKQLGLDTNNQKEILLQKIDETILKISDVTGRFNNLDANIFSDIVDRIMQRHNLPETYREFAESQAQMMRTEIGFFMETFGQLTHSSDALLNMTGQVIEEMWGKHATKVQRRFRKFTKVMDDNNIDAKQIAELYDNGYLLNIYDFSKFDDKLAEVDSALYNSVLGENVTVDQYKKLKAEGTLKPYTSAQQLEVNQKRQEMLSDFVERRMNDEYYNKQAEKYKKLGISLDTIRFLKGISIERAILQNSVLDEKGRPIYTQDEKAQLDSLSQLRKENKSLINNLGILKEGINEFTPETAPEGVRKIEKGGLIYTLSEDASNEAKIAFELHLIDQDFQVQERSKNINAFKKEIVETADKSVHEAIEFVKNNIGVTFSSTFWDNLLSNESIIDNPEVNAVEGNKIHLKQIRQKRNALSQLKRLYQDHRNPVEIRGDQMSNSEQEVIKALVEEIDLLTRKLVIPETVERDTDFATISSTNRAYDSALRLNEIEEGSPQEFEFIKKHVTERNSSFLRSLENDAKNLDAGNPTNISQRTIDNLEQNKREGETYYQAFLNIARQRVLPYYKRFSPENYRTIDEVLQEPGTNEEKVGRLIDYITEIENDPNYDFNVHHTFRSGEDMAVNPNYNTEFKGGFHQPKLSKFTNRKFIKTFNPVIKDSKVVSVRKNKELYNALIAIEELQTENLKDVGLLGTHNLYLAPQISRTRTNQVLDLLKKSNKTGTLKEILKETFNYRIDDLEYGAQENKVDILKATDARIVPTFYTKKLEDPKDVSPDLFYSYLAMTNQSVLNRLRRDGLSDILALEDKMLQRVGPDGKRTESTRNYKMMRSAIDYNFFGVKETRKFKTNLPIFGEVDLTRVLRGLHKYVRFRNLGLNVIVPFTSAITAETNLRIEGAIGEYISKDALRLATKEFRKLAPEASKSKNSLAYNDKSKLNVLGEFLQVYEMSDKAANAQYPTLMRWIPKMGMVLHQVGNFPVIPRVFLSVLFDHRVINGKIISKQEFVRANRQSDKPLSKKDVNVAWKQYEGDSIYNYMNITEEGVVFKPELLSKLDGDQQYLDNKLQRIRSIVKDQVQKIDGQIPQSQKTQAQRDVLWNYLMTHRGWLAITAQRRLKSVQYNVETGQIEEGTYVTMKNLLVDMFGNLGTGQDRTWNVIKAFKQAMKGRGRLAEKLGIKPSEELLSQERELIERNIKRVGIEMAFMTGIIAIVAAVSAMADDEDNEDLYSLQLTNYFLYRLANETASTQLGLFGEFSEVIEQPFVGYGQVVDAFNVSTAFDTDIIKQGTYKGHTGTYKYFFKSTPGLKGLHDLINVRNTANTYRYYRGQSINQASLGLFSLLTEE